MTNKFYNYLAPVVAGSTIRSDKYNTDQLGINSAFESVELDLNKRLTLPDTFTGNSVIPEVTAEDSFLYIDENNDITLYPAATFQAQFDDINTKYGQINIWQGQVAAAVTASANSASSASNSVTLAATQTGLATAQVALAADQVVLASDEVVLASNQVALASTQRSLASEWASNPKNVIVSGTTEFSAKHWADKAQEYADQTLATAEGDFVPFSRTINSMPLSADIVLNIADIPSLASDLNGKAPISHVHEIADVTGLQSSIDFNFALAAAGI